jgi:hypothetical protein
MSFLWMAPRLRVPHLRVVCKFGNRIPEIPEELKTLRNRGHGQRRNYKDTTFFRLIE